MEELKEKLELNFKDYEKAKKQFEKMLEKERKLTNKYNYCYNLPEYQKIEENIEKNKIDRFIIKNNIKFLVQKIICSDEELKKIYNKYENKNIGEKTKQKIQEKVKQLFLNKYNLKIRFYISFDYSWSNNQKTYNKFSLYIENKNSEYSNFLEISFYERLEHEEFTKQYIFEMSKYGWHIIKDSNNIYHLFGFNNKSIEFYPEHKKQANILYNQKKQVIKKLNDKIEEINNLYKNLNDQFFGELEEKRIQKNNINYISIY